MRQDHDDLRNLADNSMRATETKKQGKVGAPSANARQVGGNHYKTGGLELWDLFGPEAIMFYAVRYVARWRKKNGLQDLQKGKHVVEKLRELGGARRPMLAVDRATAESWCKNQGCTWVEQTIIMRIMFWESKEDIDEAITGIEYLIQTEERAMPTGIRTDGKIVSDAIKRLQQLPQGSVTAPVTVTNTPRAGETEAQIAARERRVPRYVDQGPPPGDSLASLINQPDTLYPWVTKSIGHLIKDGIDTPLLELFWTKRGENYVLDAHVTSLNIPRVVVHCYVFNGGESWTIDIKKIPAEAREYYPSLKEMLNKVEWEELPGWQRALYGWRPAHSKYELLDQLWHVEEPLAAHYNTMETGHG